MPIRKGIGKRTIGKNIQELTKSGKPRKQATAIALGSARKSAKAAGKPSKGPAPKRKKGK